MIVTTYTCDRCTHAQATSLQMWHVSVCVTDRPLQPRYTSATRVHEVLWCRDCVSVVGITFPPPVVPPDTPKPTFEDFIREIMRDEIANASER